METRLCEHCGLPIEGDTKFCTNCGAPIPPLADQQPQQPYYEPQPAQQPQPQPQPQPQLEEMPNNHLGLAIATAIICCIPLGIPAIVNASKVNGLWNNGQYEEARRASKNAVTWTIVSAVAGFVFSIVYAIVLMADEF